MGARSSLACLCLLLLLPVAAAQVPSPTPPTAGDAPTLPTVIPTLDPTTLLEEGPLLVQGPATSPTRIVVSDPNGTAALTYTLGSDGRARVLVADEVVLEDATLLRMEGAPTDDVFTLFLRDAEGAEHALTVNRLKLLADAPEGPAIDLVRPPAWPGSPEKPFLLLVQDARPNRIAAADLDGTRFLRRADTHTAILQMPSANATWDRIVLEAGRAGGPNVTAVFDALPVTDDAAAFRALYNPWTLTSVQEGDTIALRVLYERRLTPLVVERFPEDDYRYRLDGRGPTVTLNAPASSNDFRFALAWDGKDDLTGAGGFAVDVRKQGAAAWTRWLDGTSDKSAVFSGDWSTTYEFRVFSLDGVGNPSQPATATVAVGARPEGNDEVNRAPFARLVAPADNSELRGLVDVAWQASDPDGTPVTSRLELSSDDGASWRILYVGTGTSYAWHTDEELDGASYRLRLTVSDGTAQASDAASGFVIDNVAAPATGGLPGAQPPSPGTTGTTGAGGGAAPGTSPTPGGAEDLPEPAEPEKGVPGAGALVAALALVGAALLLRRR